MECAATLLSLSFIVLGTSISLPCISGASERSVRSASYQSHYANYHPREYAQDGQGSVVNEQYNQAPQYLQVSSYKAPPPQTAYNTMHVQAYNAQQPASPYESSVAAYNAAPGAVAYQAAAAPTGYEQPQAASPYGATRPVYESYGQPGLATTYNLQAPHAPSVYSQGSPTTAFAQAPASYGAAPSSQAYSSPASTYETPQSFSASPSRPAPLPPPQPQAPPADAPAPCYNCLQDRKPPAAAHFNSAPDTWQYPRGPMDDPYALPDFRPPCIAHGNGVGSCNCGCNGNFNANEPEEDDDVGFNKFNRRPTDMMSRVSRHHQDNPHFGSRTAAFRPFQPYSVQPSPADYADNEEVRGTASNI